MEVDWDACGQPSEWTELKHCAVFIMCRYWARQQLLEFVLRPGNNGIPDLYFGVAKEVYLHIANSSPFTDQVLTHYKFPGESRTPNTPFYSAKLPFKLPDREP